MKNVIQGSLITTFRCNAQCNMCNIWKFQTNPNEEIDASYYEKLPAGLRINITGGERRCVAISTRYLKSFIPNHDFSS